MGCYNSNDECFATHEGAQEAMEGLGDAFGYGEGSRVVELRLSLPSAKPLAVAAGIPDGEGTVKIKIG